jgi:hypothetical protein
VKAVFESQLCVNDQEELEWDCCRMEGGKVVVMIERLTIRFISAKRYAED